MTMPLSIRLIRLSASAVAAALALAGCASDTYLTYQPKAGDATLLVLQGGYPGMCSQDGSYRMEPVNAADPHAVMRYSIPSGKRLTVEANMHHYATNITYSCNPSVSFVPVAGKTYALDAYMSKPACSAYVVRVDDSTATGVALEPTEAGPSCRYVPRYK
jgi:hypothetical protein